MAGCNLLHILVIEFRKAVSRAAPKRPCLCVLPGVRVSLCACVFQGLAGDVLSVATPANSDSGALQGSEFKCLLFLLLVATERTVTV